MYTRLLLKSAPVLNRIYTHPFNAQLASGRLPPHVFQVFIEQDSHYLKGFSCALKSIAHRFRQPSYIHQFEQLSTAMVASERKIHEEYLKKIPFNRFFSKSNQLSSPFPVVRNYIEHLQTVAHYAPLEVAVAACLPCFVVYQALGEQMQSNCVFDNPYARWIQSYSSERFVHATNGMIQTLQELTLDISETSSSEKAIWSAFNQSVEYEYTLFDEVINHNKSTLIIFNNLMYNNSPT